jgi:hypothetical protein
MRHIAYLLTQGIGPHSGSAAPLKLTGPGYTDISGPSEAGKTAAAVHGLLLTLTGAAPGGEPWPVELISADRAEAAIALDDRSTLRRTLTPARSSTWTTRTPQAGGEPVSTSHKSQSAWQEAIGLDAAIAAPIVTPGEVWALASASRGRPLRDLLQAVSPPQDLRAIVSEWMDGLRDDEPHVEGKARTQGAASRATVARRAADEAAGAARQAEAALAAAEVPPNLPAVPDPEYFAELARKATAAQGHLDALHAHHAYLADVAAWRSGEAGRAAQGEAATRWRAQVDALGGCPASLDPPLPGDVFGRLHAAQAELQAADVAVRAAVEAVRAADRPARPKALLDAEAAMAAAQAAVAEAHEGPSAGACPCCGQSISPEVRAQHLARREATLSSATIRLDDIEHALRDDAAEARAAAADVLARAEAERAERAQALVAAEAAAEAHREAERASDRRTAERARWQAQRAAIGDCPAVPEATPEPAAVPAPAWGLGADIEARAVAAVAAHRSAFEAAARHAEVCQALQVAHAAALARAQATAKTAQGAAQTAATAAARAVALLDAVRRAPTEAARRSDAALRAALGDCGVAIEWGSAEGTGPEVSVLIDGRPWWCASAGRRLIAEVSLRLALRRLALARYGGAYEWLPVVADGAQDWSGAWPALRPGECVWRLYTRATPGGRLTVAKS